MIDSGIWFRRAVIYFWVAIFLIGLWFITLPLWH
jgi:hypothetical protein